MRLERWRRDTRGKRGYDGVGRGYDGVGRVWREKGAGVVRGLGAALGEIPAASAGMTEWGRGYDGGGAGVAGKGGGGCGGGRGGLQWSGGLGGGQVT